MHRGIKSWESLVIFAYSYFSIPLLLNTLFNPFENDKPSKNFDILEIIVFAIFSRILGFIMRIILIIIGLAFTILMILLFPVFFFIPINIDREYLRDLGSIGSELSYGNTFYLNKHTQDVISPINLKIYGKEKTLRMIERALDKNTNRNALLVGDNGVGKSLVLSYLGRLGKSGLSFPGIAHHRVVNFAPDNISIEEFERAMNEATRAGNVILGIENIYQYESLFEHILPYLDKPTLGIVATTDFSNYDHIIKTYPEFLSKFEKIDMAPTSYEETILTLKNHILIKKLKINEDAVIEIVRLADKYIGNQSEPLRSLLVLEELSSLGGEITIEEVRRVISDKTNIQIGDLTKDEKDILISLEENMRNEIMGQDEAVKDVTEALKRLRVGISNPDKPAGSFLFLGPTGVGKTYTAKILAESYFGRKNAMIRFDMSEFSLASSVPIFIDRVASVIEEMPLSLVFFDELEKANKAIHQLLLQILDEGRITRESGREASFKNAIIIATTNAESISIIKNPNIDKKVLINNLISSNIFSPEFLNRWSGIILFKPLGQSEIKKVSKLLLLDFAKRLYEDKGITLEITEALIDKIASVGFDPDFGARPIHRAIEEIVENKVADMILVGLSDKNIKIM